MKRVFSILLVLILVLNIAAISFAQKNDNNDKDSKARAYFIVKNSAGKATVHNLIRHEFPGNMISIESSKADIQSLKKNKDLEFVSDVGIYQLSSMPMITAEADTPGGGSSSTTIDRTCADASFKPNWPKIGFDVNYMHGSFDKNLTAVSGGAGVKIAVLDTGANVNHPDIASRIKYCADATTHPLTIGSCSDDFGYPFGHGTPVSSVIAADSGADGKGMFGVAPQADLYIIKVCHGYCYDDDISAGIYDAINHDVNIISMSFGGLWLAPGVKTAIDTAYSHNILLIASAGNTDAYQSITYPAAYSKVISVGSINQGFSQAPYTSPGFNNGDYIRDEKEIEFGAPGVDIVMASAGPDPFHGCQYYFENIGGTSFAAPHVTGLAALLWNGNASDTRARMQASAMLKDVGPAGDDIYTGFGLPTKNLVDLETKNLYMSKFSNLTAGGNVIVSFDIQNNGNLPVSGIPVLVEKGSGTMSFNIPTLQPNEAKHISLNWLYSQAGTYDVKITVNPLPFPSSAIPEYPKSNNVQNMEVSILAPDPPVKIAPKKAWSR